MLGMRHQADDVPTLVADPRDRVGAAVDVVLVVEGSVGSAVPEHDEALPLDPAKLVLAGHELALAVLHRDAKDVARDEPAGQRREGRPDPDVDPPADEPELSVADQRAGEQARLAQDLEPVADPDDGSSARREGPDLLHDPGKT